MSLSERTYEAITQFPAWLESFDALNIPAWGVLLALVIAAVGLIFAVREFLSWFLKTSAIVDEVIRLEIMVRDLQGDLAALEVVVERLQTTAGVPANQIAASQTKTEVALATPVVESKPKFRLDL